jgi:hypothetical protein
MYRVTVIKQGATIYRKTGSFTECARIYNQLTADLYPGTIIIEIKTTQHPAPDIGKISMVQQHRIH